MGGKESEGRQVESQVERVACFGPEAPRLLDERVFGLQPFVVKLERHDFNRTVNSCFLVTPLPPQW